MSGVAELLIGKGYFPYTAIPALTSQKLADAMIALPLDDSPKTSKLCVHSIPKRKNFRRLLAIPNPIHQIPLCQALEENWAQLATHCQQSEISGSTPAILSEGSRALVSKFRRAELTQERVRRSTSKRVLLKADISRFYPSLYTHSIPWALHGKALAKKNHSDSLAGNLIDKCVRNAQDGQTLGVPIGPDSSFLIAQVIASSIDVELQSRIPQLSGVRYIDDFWLYLPDRAMAESALAALHMVTKTFELEVNDLKTEISDLPDEVEPYWVSELRGYRFRTKPGPQRTDLVGFFSRAFEYSIRHPTDSVLTYALKTSSNRKITPENWPLYESLLLKAVMAEPSALQAFAQILAAYEDMEDVNLDDDRIATTLGEICKYHAQLQHGYEVAWSLWIARQFHLEIPTDAMEGAASVEDAIVALAALDLICNGGAACPSLELWKTLMTAETLYSGQWLLAYEAAVKGWLPTVDRTDYISDDPFFCALRELDVQFYDTGAEIIEAEIGGY